MFVQHLRRIPPVAGGQAEGRRFPGSIGNLVGRMLVVPFHRVLSLLTGAAWPLMLELSRLKGKKLIVRRFLFCLAQMIAFSFKIRVPKASTL